jgi:hypothetical protein
MPNESKSATWPKYPFAIPPPEDRVPRDKITRDAIRLIHPDWDGENFGIVYHDLRAMSLPPKEIVGMSITDIRERFQGQVAVTIPVMLATTANTIVPYGKREGPPEAKVHPATLAKAILFEQPDISPTKLAERIGVTRSTLYKTTPPWKDVRAILLARGDSDTGYEVDGKPEAEHERPTDG